MASQGQRGLTLNTFRESIKYSLIRRSSQRSEAIPNSLTSCIDSKYGIKSRPCVIARCSYSSLGFRIRKGKEQSNRGLHFVYPTFAGRSLFIVGTTDGVESKPSAEQLCVARRHLHQNIQQLLFAFYIDEHQGSTNPL